MGQREDGMQEIENRCNPLFASIPLKYLKRSPSTPVGRDEMPCVLIMEGSDPIYKRGGRTYQGYPCKRTLSVIIECWDLSTDEGGDVKAIANEVRRVVLAEDGVLVGRVKIREEDAAGPYNLGIPNIEGFRVIFSMPYIDDGPAF